MDALRTACEIVGSQRKLADMIGVTPAYVSQILAGMRPVPPERVLAIEEATGHRVSRHDLRPDIYPREPWCRCPACERAQSEKDGAAA